MPRKIGRHAVHPPADAGADHAAHFNAALRDALQNIGWPNGKYERVQLTLELDVTVTNPGKVDEYKVVLQS